LQQVATELQQNLREPLYSACSRSLSQPNLSSLRACGFQDLEVRVHSRFPLVPTPECFPEKAQPLAEPRPHLVTLVKLGPLEQKIIAALQTRGSSTVSELVKYTDHSLTASTIRTTLDRLFRKGLLDREPEGSHNRFRYGLRQSEERERQAAKAIIANLLRDNSPEVSLSYLVDVICDFDVKLLAEFERVLEEKHRQLHLGRGKVWKQTF
jgi:predicted transcriptional regulator